MSTVIINGNLIQVSSKPYYDFFIDKTTPRLVSINVTKMLEWLSSGTAEFGELEQEIYLLSRWVHEAPRKRMLRNMILAGIHVASRECFFVELDNGDEIIDSLERTGKLAESILKAYGKKPMGPIVNNSQSPIQEKELLNY